MICLENRQTKRKTLEIALESVKPGRDWFSCATSVKKKMYTRKAATDPLPLTPLFITGTFQLNGPHRVASQDLQGRNSNNDTTVYFVWQLADFQSLFIPWQSLVCETDRTCIFKQITVG